MIRGVKKPLDRSPRTRRVLFRLLALLVGLAPVTLIEALFVAFDAGRPAESADPFVGFSSVRPLFVRNGDRFETAPYRLRHFAIDSFSAEKPPGEFRVFVIGDSTVQGNPWSIETSFTKWLELSLAAADPSRAWRVINCGGISYASYRMVPILEEVLAYAPDLVIVHASHNEFLEERTYGTIKRLAPTLAETQEWLSRLRTFNVLRGAVERCSRPRKAASADRTVLSAEVEALLDYRGGLECYHRDERWRRGVVAHFEWNLRRMARIARDAGVPLVLMNPASNLRDSPPFKSEHRADATAEELVRWEQLWSEARTHYANDRPRALAILREAAAIDDEHAGLRYDLAKCLDAMGLVDDARREYLAAKELDICPLRILKEMNAIVATVALDTRTPVVDVRALFDRISRNGIPGGDWFVDHVHPTITGYQRLAAELMTEFERLGVVQASPDWEERRDRLFEAHLRSLDTLYFVKGQQHLEGLTNWAHGRVTNERPMTERAENLQSDHKN